MQYRFEAKINTEGRLKLKDPLSFDHYIRKMKGDVTVTVGYAKKYRTTPQSNYYWGEIVTTMVNITGYTKEECHDILKYKFLSDTEDDAYGLRRTRSTSTLSTSEMSMYNQKARVWINQMFDVLVEPPRGY